MKPPFDVLGAMVYYIDAFPERFHHPKEDEYLFLRLRARCPEAGPLLDQLRGGASGWRREDPHARADARALPAGRRYRRRRPSSAAVEDYAAFHWQHMGREEKELLPLAEKHLTAGDWKAIDAAFSGNTRSAPRRSRRPRTTASCSGGS